MSMLTLTHDHIVSAATTTASATTTTATKTTATATKTTATATSTATGSSSFPSGNTTISSWISGQEDTSRSVMLGNINPPGSATGFISASLSTSGPDYYYHWTRVKSKPKKKKKVIMLYLEN